MAGFVSHVFLVACSILAVVGFKVKTFRNVEPELASLIILKLRFHMDDVPSLITDCNEVSELSKLSAYDISHQAPNIRAQQMVGEGCDTLILEAMKKHKYDKTLQMSCISALHNLAQYNKDMLGVMGEHNVIEKIIQSLERFHDDPDMIMHIHDVAAFLDFYQTNQTHENIQHLLKTHYMTSVLGTLRAHESEPLVVREAVSFLGNSCEEEHMKQEVLDSGYLDRSMTYIQYNDAAPGIAGEVIKASFLCFSYDPDLREKQVKLGLFERLVEVLDEGNHGEKIDTMQSQRTFLIVCHLVQVYARTNPRHKQKIVESGIPGQIEAAIYSGLLLANEACTTMRYLLETMPGICAEEHKHPFPLPDEWEEGVPLLNVEPVSR